MVLSLKFAETRKRLPEIKHVMHANMQRVAKIKKREDPEENVDSDGLFAGDIIAQQATYGTL